MTIKKLEIKKISELTAEQKQYIIDKYGQQHFDNHKKHDALVEIVQHEEVVPFYGTFSNRLREAIKRDGLKGVRIK